VSELARVLSLIFVVYRHIHNGEWLVALGMGWYGMIRADYDLQAAHLWWAGAVAITLLGRLAAATDYAVFLRDRHMQSGAVQALSSGILKGRVAGELQRWVHPEVRVPVPVFMLGTQVQIRWLGKGRPPAVAVLSADADPNAFDPVEAAEEWSVWYPGSDVEVGWAYIAGREYPGVRVSFAGRRLVLGLDGEDECRVVAQWLIE